jgi:hypothetical protein
VQNAEAIAFTAVMRGLDPRIHQSKSLLEEMDCRVTSLRAGPAMTAEWAEVGT